MHSNPTMPGLPGTTTTLVWYRERLGEGVLAPAAADDANLHRPPSLHDLFASRADPHEGDGYAGLGRPGNRCSYSRPGAVRPARQYRSSRSSTRAAPRRPVSRHGAPIGARAGFS